MLLTRSLPPQFLLPAWSVGQLTQASQRVAASFTTYDGPPPKPKPRGPSKSFTRNRRLALGNSYIDSNQAVPDIQDVKPEPRRPGEPQKEYVFHRAIPTDVYDAPLPTKPVHNEAHNSKPLSLFDELFPEESQARSRRERAAEKKLNKLPAFKWNSRNTAPIVTDFREQARLALRAKYTSIPGRETQPEKKTLYKAVGKDTYRLERLQDDLRRETAPTILPSLLVLNACSKNLEESDFFRLGPKGNHIEGWTSGILKVIPARDRNTLEKLGYYFILCSNRAAARAFLDRTKALHKLARAQRIMEDSGIPIPPGYLQDGEDPVKLLEGFSLVPENGLLSMRVVPPPPYMPAVARLLKEGGPAARITKESKAGEVVLFSVDLGHINQYDLEEGLRDDGRRRNLHWKLGREEAGNIVKLTYDDHDDIAEESSDELEDRARESKEEYLARKKEQHRRPSRYVISFKDRNEARRFVREWHRRPFPVRRMHNPGDEPIPIVNAEILW